MKNPYNPYSPSKRKVRQHQELPVPSAPAFEEAEPAPAVSPVKRSPIEERFPLVCSLLPHVRAHNLEELNLHNALRLSKLELNLSKLDDLRVRRLVEITGLCNGIPPDEKDE